MELCIDTSTRYAAVGLSQKGHVTAELYWRSQRNHSVELIPSIQNIMDKTATDIEDLSAIFVNKGPGAFSALRVGISTAKAIAAARKIPIIGIDSGTVEAFPYVNIGQNICSVIPASRTRVYVCVLASHQVGVVTPIYTILELDELADKLDGDNIYCGESIADLDDLMKSRSVRCPTLMRTPPPTRKIGIMAEICHKLLDSEPTDTPISLQPIYVRSAQVDSAKRTWIRK